MTELGSAFPVKVTICSVDDLAAHRESGAGHVVSILDPGCDVPQAFTAYDRHERLDLRFHDVIDDAAQWGYQAPETADVEAILKFAAALPSDPPPHVLVHCFMGISRSTAAAILILASRAPDRAEGDIVAEVVRVRPQTWPNIRMIEIGDALLGRDGRLIAAVRDRHRSAARANPLILAQMRGYGRHRELEGL